MDLRGYLAGELLGLVVRHLVGTDDHAELATCLDGVGLDHARITHRRGLEVVETLDVGLHDLASCARSCTRDGVADLDDGRQQRRHLHLVVVGGDGVDDVGLLLIFLGELGAIECVGQVGLLIGHLADIVEQSGTLGLLRVETQLGGHDGAQVGRLAGVLQQVLSIGGAILHLADDAHQFGMETMDTEVDGRALSRLHYLGVELLLHLGDHLLDAGGVDAAVGHELVEGQAADLAADGVEGRDDDGLGGVIDDDLDAAGSLQGADVAALAADDATLHLVVFDMEYADAVFDGRLGGHALYGLYDDLLGLLVGVELGLVHNLVDVAGGVEARLVLHALYEARLGLLGAQS